MFYLFEQLPGKHVEKSNFMNILLLFSMDGDGEQITTREDPNVNVLHTYLLSR